MNVYEALEYLQEIRNTIPTSSIFDGKLFDKGYWVKYLNLYCGFDIETTTICENAYMWIWQFSIWNGTGAPVVVKGRTWNEFQYFIGNLKRIYNLRTTTRVIVWIANTSFEFGFIQKLFQWDFLFAKTARQPLIFRTGGIEFREALTISGGSLAYLAKTYCTTQKMVGDLDFRKLRNSKTPYDEKENRYIENDVIILSEFSKYIFDKYIKAQRYIPVTSTAILRHELKERAKAEYERIDILHNEIKALFPPTQYDYLYIMEYLFRGGFVHGVFSEMLELLFNLESFDLKSSYPAQMLKKYYPVTPFENYDVKSNDDFARILNEYCVIFQATFKNVKSKTNHSIESKSKCIKLENPLLDNGRVRECDSMTVFLTELDFENYCNFYTWETMELHSVQIAKRGELPEYLTSMVYELFEAKESIDKESNPQDYTISKTRVNGMFGMTVTRLQFMDVSYNENGWGFQESEKTYDEMISKQYLSPYWGIYICAHGRNVIISQLMKPLEKYVKYTDTDSHKFPLNAYTAKIVHDFNKAEMKANENICKIHDYKKDVIGRLGCLEWESAPKEYGKIIWFKMAGAKRYICQYEKKGFVSTISGVSKKAMKEYCERNDLNPFEFFEKGMYIPADSTGKLRAKYNDLPHSDIVTDEFGNVELMKSESSVCLLPVDFTMTMEKDFLKLIDFWTRRKVRYGN